MLPGHSTLPQNPLLPIQPLSAPPRHGSALRGGNQDALRGSQTAAQRRQHAARETVIFSTNSYCWCLTSPIAGYTPHGCCSHPAQHRRLLSIAGSPRMLLAAPAPTPAAEPCHGGRGKGLPAVAKQRGGKASSVGAEETNHRTGEPGCPQIFPKTQRQQHFPVGRAATALKTTLSEQGKS